MRLTSKSGIPEINQRLTNVNGDASSFGCNVNQEDSELRMKRLGFTVGFSASLLTTVAAVGQSDGRFHQTLPVSKQIVHVLNRLTFGPRPGDLEQVRQAGVEKWIDLQLHPERI